MPVSEFDFHALKQYITSSKDESLRAIADSHGKKYVGSSSSMTGVLAHFHFLLSQWRKINTSMVSQGFPDKLRSFTQLQRVPSAIFLRRRDGRDGAYAIDADKEFDSANILSMLGKSMEKLLTLSTDGYERYRRSNSDQIGHEERNAPESFHYCTMGDILMRSQLDAYDARLPGTGMFDLKTRAVVSIRMDADNYQRGTGYQIKNRFGEYESYEREYFDMIRSAFLKYSLQVRMGRMDGIFVAFHNTERIFGFQYISLPEMDSTLHGSWDTKTGDEEFKMSLNLLNNVLDRATAKFPDTSLRLHFETRDSQTPFMYIFAEPVTEDQIAEIQDTNKLAVEEFERNLMGLAKGEKPANGEEGEAEVIQDSEGDTANREWERIHAKVEKEMEHDELLSDASSSRHVASRRPLEDATSTLVDLAKGNPADPESGTEQIMSSWTPGDDEEVGDEEDQEEDEGDEDEDEDGEEEGQEDDDEDEDEDEDQDEDEDEEGNGEEEDESEENEEQKDGQEEKSKAKEQGNVSADGTNSAVEGGSNQMIDTSSTLGSDATVLDTSEPQQPLLEDLLSEDAIAEDTEGHGDKAWLDEVDLEQQRLVPQDGSRSVMAMTLTVRNKVNGEYVARPENLAGSDQWSVEYALSEVVSEARAWSLYNACQLRRKKRFDIIDDDDGDKNYYKRILRELSAKGRKWRDEQDSLEARHGKVVFDPSRSEEASGSSPPR
ncbi:MAG: hypothetical protein M1837_001725 [Sclerophora amabilis]|nr:MAG: hypothetical protein M1837_001725 [Sclerophora amabilis]